MKGMITLIQLDDNVWQLTVTLSCQFLRTCEESGRAMLCGRHLGPLWGVPVIQESVTQPARQASCAFVSRQQAEDAVPTILRELEDAQQQLQKRERIAYTLDLDKLIAGNPFWATKETDENQPF